MSRLLLLLSIAFLIAVALCPLAAQAQSPRVTEAYTAWDDYFFYAGFQVSDSNVISTNRTPTSQPQQDDDIEVFFETDGPGKAAVRTDKTYQMAVSAGNGAYFSQGDGTPIPKAKLVLTYKYAATVDGTLNNPADKDIGYTIELAIPWTELGLSGPPAPGAVWGFNVISRDRDSLTTPADKFVSLSPQVQSAADVQNPSKWTKIEFVNTVASMHSTTDIIYSPHVQTQYPVIDGVLSSGEWDEADGFSFGANWNSAPAPTVAQEPNISLSPFSSEAANQPPPAAAGTQAASASPGYDILLPGGGTLHVGRTPNPSATITPFSPPEQYTPPSKGKHGHGGGAQVAQLPPPGGYENPLTPKGYGPLVNPVGPNIDTTQALPLTPQTDVGSLIVAPFVMSYSPRTPLNALLDQPMDGQGMWFGGMQVGWDVEQVRDARRAGVDVLLPIYNPSDPDANAELDTLVEAIKEIRADGDDYPLLGLRTSDLNDETAKDFFDHVPDDLLAQIVLPDSDGNQPAAIVVADHPAPAAIDTANADAFVDTIAGREVIMTTPAGMPNLKIATVSPGGRDSDGHLASRALAQAYQSSWQTAVGSTPNWMLLNSWNDYAKGTEAAASRQYGEQYADLTKVMSLTWSQQEWQSRYLSNTCPTVIAPNTLYTVTVRIENTGSL
ncbi:MAG TPA: sugar-binding protein, partial [Acidisoma sp.]|nr:sugar-binding protein [Acidisoma sp.]